MKLQGEASRFTFRKRYRKSLICCCSKYCLWFTHHTSISLHQSLNAACDMLTTKSEPVKKMWKNSINESSSYILPMRNDLENPQT